jgi:hypothetical protein
MKFGISLPTTGPLAAGPGALEGQLAIAHRAEALGFESLWAPDLKGMLAVMEDFARKVGM